MREGPKNFTARERSGSTVPSQLVDTVGRDCGCIMNFSTGLDDAKPENVKALFDFTREYGVH